MPLVSLILRGKGWKHLSLSVPVARTNNTSGQVGVYQDKKTAKWKAEIIVDGNYHGLGYYEFFTDAVNARKRAEEELWVTK